MERMKHVYNQYNNGLNDKEMDKAIEDILLKEYAANDNIDVYRKCFSMIDLTSLNATDTDDQIGEMMEKVNNFQSIYTDMPNIAAVCVYPSLVPVAKATLELPNINIASVSAGFPSSQTFIETKVAETAMTVMAGANEIDVVISLGKFISGFHTEVIEELEEIKVACRSAKLKVILESGALRSTAEIQQASICAITAGADFIKTSTGKIEPAASLKATYIMCQTIKEYYEKTGEQIGIKPAGGISTTQDAVKYYTIVKHILGEEWTNNKLFRFGASKLANNLLTSIYNKEVKYF